MLTDTAPGFGAVPSGVASTFVGTVGAKGSWFDSDGRGAAPQAAIAVNTTAIEANRAMRAMRAMRVVMTFTDPYRAGPRVRLAWCARAR